MKALILCLVGLLAAAPSFADSAPFFERLKGSYRIEKVGGEPPHGGNDVATVEFDSGQYVFTFPYCPPGGGCDPGYIFFDPAQTTVSADGDITTKDGGTITHYRWRESGAVITFENPQYRLPNGNVVTLGFVVSRL